MDVEPQSKFAKGLCCWCDSKYSPSHRCKNRELQVLLVQEDNTESKAPPQVSCDEPLDEEIQKIIELSLNSVVGLSSPKAMKVRGQNKQREVIALIDCGVNHNFISTKLVRDLALSLKGTLGYGVVLGTGVAAKGGVCQGIVFALQNIEIVEDFLPLELGSADVILGMK